MRAQLEWNVDGTVTVTLIPEGTAEPQALMDMLKDLGNDHETDVKMMDASAYAETDTTITAIPASSQGEVLLNEAGEDPQLEIRLFRRPE